MVPLVPLPPPAFLASCHVFFASRARAERENERSIPWKPFLFLPGAVSLLTSLPSFCGNTSCPSKATSVAAILMQSLCWCLVKCEPSPGVPCNILWHFAHRGLELLSCVHVRFLPASSLLDLKLLKSLRYPVNTYLVHWVGGRWVQDCVRLRDSSFPKEIRISRFRVQHCWFISGNPDSVSKPWRWDLIGLIWSA